MTSKQSRLIGALLVHRTAAAACKAAGVSDRSYRTWKTLPAFAAALKEARAAAMQDTIGALQALTLPAARMLRRLLHCGDPAVRLRACQTIIDRALRGAELVDLVERIEALEAADNRRGGIRGVV